MCPLEAYSAHSVTQNSTKNALKHVIFTHKIQKKFWHSPLPRLLFRGEKTPFPISHFSSASTTTRSWLRHWRSIEKYVIGDIRVIVGSNILNILFARESSYCFQCVLAIAILSVRLLSVRLSVTRVDQSKAVQAKITKSSQSVAWKTLVSRTVKLFHKFERSHPEQER